MTPHVPVAGTFYTIKKFLEYREFLISQGFLVEFSGESVSLSKPAPEEFKKDQLIFENCQSIDKFNVVARMVCKLYTKDSSTKELARLAPNLLEDEVPV